MSKEVSSWVVQLAALTVVSVLSIASVAPAAEDGKVYPGIMCQRSLGSAEDIEYGDLGVYNKSLTASLVVLCPVVRDVVSGVLGANSAEVRVRQGGSTTIICTLASRGPHGDPPVTQNGQQEPPDAFPGLKTIKFGQIAAVSAGYYYFICILPPAERDREKSGVISYRLDENDV